MPKFKGKIVGRVREENEMHKEQMHLKEKYGMVQEDVVIIEKNNFIKFFIGTFARILRMTASLLIFFLSVTGLAALIYPGSRMELIRQAVSIYNELTDLLPFM